MGESWIVITSIHEPTEGVRKFVEWDGWRLLVVGDRKTPRDWDVPGVVYLDMDEQIDLFGEYAVRMPQNTYTRKALGYAYAIRNGADAIFETDDDNIPYALARWAVESILDGCGPDETRIGGEWRWVNIYRHFGAPGCWPRGYPLFDLQRKQQYGTSYHDMRLPWGVVQFLVDVDPDVDAIYRMTRGDAVYFERDKFAVLDRGQFCPTNSQATLWTPESFPFMFLPVGVPDRVTDIMRGIMSTACLWSIGRSVAFASPVMCQKRNAHSLQKDFTDEVTLYTGVDEWAKRCVGVNGGNAIESFRMAIRALEGAGALPPENRDLYEMFLVAAGLK